MGCSIATEMIAPLGNFALGMYNADTYITKDCKWYEKVMFSPETKEWFRDNSPPLFVIDDLKKVSYNNDMAKELCDN